MTDTTIEALEQQLQAKRAEQEAESRRLLAEREERELAYARQQVAEYDRLRYAAESRAAWAAFIDAMEQTPVFAALAEAQAAKWREHRAAHAETFAQQTIARATGQPAPRPYDGAAPLPITPETLIRALEQMVSERMARDEEHEMDRARQAVEIPELAPERVAQHEHEQELARRRAAAEGLDTSTDVSGMTDAQREALGLPTGNSRPERDRRY